MADDQSFTSWKLSIIDAVSCDPNVTDMDFRVAYRIMQHVNRESRVAHVTMDRLAAQLDVSRDTIMRSVRRLQGKADPRRDDHRPTQWIEAKRASRTSPYFYRFTDRAMNAVLDGKVEREDGAKARLRSRKQSLHDVAGVQGRAVFDVADVQGQDAPDVADGTPRDVADGTVTDVATRQPIHLCVNNLPLTPTSQGHEGEGYTPTRARDDTAERQPRSNAYAAASKGL
ncbi:MAG: hypothetical protein ED558_13815 [Oricola sp.]|nr:MAG: hypothetical protein ED558_13815 [Oricola sp.]